jgi:hypothetical protein
LIDEAQISYYRAVNTIPFTAKGPCTPLAVGKGNRYFNGLQCCCPTETVILTVYNVAVQHLATSYDLILLPKFETSHMVLRKDRVIGSRTARQMVTWAHYRFQQRLLFKCRQHNCRIAIVDESYTSKTCSACGALDYKLGGKKVYRCSSCKMVMDRDINGAKNIFLKNFEALALELALGPTPCTLETGCCTETAMSLLNFCSFETRESFEILEV